MHGFTFTLSLPLYRFLQCLRFSRSVFASPSLYVWPPLALFWPPLAPFWLPSGSPWATLGSLLASLGNTCLVFGTTRGVWDFNINPCTKRTTSLYLSHPGGGVVNPRRGVVNPCRGVVLFCFLGPLYIYIYIALLPVLFLIPCMCFLNLQCCRSFFRFHVCLFLNLYCCRSFFSVVMSRNICLSRTETLLG